MNTTSSLPGMGDLVADLAESAAECAATGSGDHAAEPPRLRRPDRAQVLLEPTCLDQRLPADHPARSVWAVVERLDLRKFNEPILARGETPGRAATDPQLLVGLWLYATIDNVGSARRLDALCREHDAYRWLCGGVSLNHHTLSDFRVAHEKALDDLMTQVIAALVAREIVKVERISQDSLRVRAAAGSGSFRRKETLERLREAARAHVEQVKRQADESSSESARRSAAQRRAAQERLARVEAALAVMPELEAIKENHSGKPAKGRPPRASTTDAQARRIRTGEGAILPAYNVQFGTDTASRAVLGVEVINVNSDQSQSGPMRAQVERRTGLKVKEQLFDGGYVKKEQIESAESSGVAIYAPLPSKKDGQPCTQARSDTAGVRAWRERMTGEAGRNIYKERAATAETVNAETKTYRGLSRFLVRGLSKVRCVALWSALAYNVVHFGSQLTG